MPKVSPIQTRFNAGELSPLVKGRVDIEQWNAGLETCKNYIPRVSGPITRRPGTRYVADVKNTVAEDKQLIPFNFSAGDGYLLEFGDQYIRFYRDSGQLTSGGSPYEVSTNWSGGEVRRLGYTQSADKLYVTHANEQPTSVNRLTDTNWTVTAIDFEDGPYLPENITATTMSASSGAGSVTVIASSVTGINDGAGFSSTPAFSDVGRHLRIYDAAGTTWGWGKITAVNSPTSVDVTIQAGSFPTTGTTQWRLGSWSDYAGWPQDVFFYEDRLCFIGAPQTPSRVDMSRPGDYANFSPGELDGTVADDHALAFTLNSGEVNTLLWAVPHNRGLLLGATGSEWLVTASDNGPLTPTSVTARRVSSYGLTGYGCRPWATPFEGYAIALFGAGDQVKAIDYNNTKERLVSQELLTLAEHLTLSETIAGTSILDSARFVKTVAFPGREPRVYLLRNDGVVVVGTFDPQQQVLAWSTLELGGGRKVYDIQRGRYSKSRYTYDQLWMIVGEEVSNYISPSEICYLEVEYRGGVGHVPHGDYLDYRLMTEKDAFYVDLGLSYDGTAASAITGLSHLEGETVSVLADGVVHPDRTVSGGQITLNQEASVVQVGLSYDSIAKTLPIEAGAADGTAQGKTKRAHSLVLRLFETMGLQVGPNESDLETVLFRESSDPMGVATPFYTGDKIVPFEDDYDRQGQVVLKQNQPTPGTILAIMPQLNTQDD